MALNFPISPTNGQIYTDTQSGNRWTWDAANTAWLSTSTFTQTITVSSTQPGSPVVGQLWWNQDYGRLLVYYNDGTSSQWVDASPSDYTSALAYAQANVVFGVANAAYGKANTALANTSGVVFAGNLNITGNVGIATTSPGAPISFGNLDGAKVYLRNNTNEYAVGVETNELRIASYSATTFYSGGYSGTERMRISNSGYVTLPYQPAFHVYDAVGTGTSSGTYIKNTNLTNVVHNIGSNWDTSTCKFTAPVAGKYFFFYCSNISGNQTHDLVIYVNGVARARNYDASSTTWTSHSAMAMVYMSVNDYVEFYYTGDPDAGLTWHYAGGYLLS